MRQYNFSTLIAFVSRADTPERILQAKSVIRQQYKLDLWQYDELYNALRDNKRRIEKEKRG